MLTRRVGFLVNPVAGMGGRVGLKGTDSPDDARRLGASPVAPDRARRFLAALAERATVLTVGGSMGEDACEAVGTSAIVVHAPSEPTTRKDTEAAVRALVEAGLDVLVFVGGDGTASDVAEALGGADTPTLGVPSGVKMYSAVFAETPERAADVVLRFDAVGSAEVLDIDEDAFRHGELRVALRGVLRVPTHKAVQAGKLAGEDDEVEQATLAEAGADLVREGGTWILGPGSTVFAVKRALGVDATLLGVDAVRAGSGTIELLASDAAERDLLALPDPVRIMVSPIGAQGFVLGRGNLQISPAILRRAGPEGVVVVATPTKLISTPVLHVDTGDPALDATFPPFVRVVTGHHTTKLVKIA